MVNQSDRQPTLLMVNQTDSHCLLRDNSIFWGLLKKHRKIHWRISWCHISKLQVGTTTSFHWTWNNGMKHGFMVHCATLAYIILTPCWLLQTEESMLVAGVHTAWLSSGLGDCGCWVVSLTIGMWATVASCGCVTGTHMSVTRYYYLTTTPTGTTGELLHLQVSGDLKEERRAKDGQFTPVHLFFHRPKHVKFLEHPAV